MTAPDSGDDGESYGRTPAEMYDGRHQINRQEGKNVRAHGYGADGYVEKVIHKYNPD